MAKTGNTNWEIRQTGAVYTPMEVTREIVKHVLSKLPKRNLEILEPSVGDGYFLSAILRDDEKQKRRRRNRTVAVDIDKNAVGRVEFDLRTSFSKSSEFIHSDFLELSNTPNSKFDLIIGNPPFIKRHNYSSAFKTQIETLAEMTNYPLKFLRNAWAAFVVASISKLSKQGILAFVLPYELLSVEYGRAIQDKLVAEFGKIDIYVPDEKAFKTIEQDAVVLIASRVEQDTPGYFVHRVRCLSDLTPISSAKVSSDEAPSKSIDLRSFILAGEAVELIKRLRSEVALAEDYLFSRPGLVTAANEFFILSESEASKRGLIKWCEPVLQKGVYLPNKPVFTQKDYDELKARQAPALFLRIEGKKAEFFSKSVFDYIQEGVEKRFNERYKCRHRKPWYQVPYVSSAKAFFLKRCFSHPTFCINEAGVLTTDSAYGVTPKDGYSVRGLCFSFYNPLTMMFSEIDGRFYGGGVLELTPKEFRGLPLPYIEPTDEQFSDFEAIFFEGANLSERLIQYGGGWLKEHMGLNEAEIELLISSWERLRAHRLRHAK